MPIAVRVVSDQEYAKWLVKAKLEFASAPPADDGKSLQSPSPRLAQLEK
jgi:heme/copper-type cytochrome/quinol oxidase subunit 2